MPRKERVGPMWSPSAVWLYTTSRITSMPASCSAFTIVLNSPTCSPRCPVPDQERDGRCALAGVHQEVTGRLCRPGAVRVRGDAGQVNPAGSVPGDDQRGGGPGQHGGHGGG